MRHIVAPGKQRLSSYVIIFLHMKKYAHQLQYLFKESSEKVDKANRQLEATLFQT